MTGRNKNEPFTPKSELVKPLRELANTLDLAIEAGNWALVMKFALDAQRKSAHLHEYAKKVVIEKAIN